MKPPAVIAANAQLNNSARVARLLDQTAALLHSTAHLAGASLALASTRILLKTHGFGTTLHWARKYSARLRRRDVSRENVLSIARAVATAGAFFPGRARCLEQSLALYYLLRRGGVAAELRLGVQPYKFHAHAWVEWQGEPVNERSEVLRGVVALPDLPVR